MNSKEQKRLMMVNEVERGQVCPQQAAQVLGLSVRQLRRLLRRRAAMWPL